MTTVLLAGGGTGGHLMPALAVAEAIKSLRPGWQFVFAGAERGIEARVLPERGVRFHLFPFQPLYRRQWWKNARWPALLPSLLRRVDLMLEREQPAAVIGTGGYVSGPVLWRAARRRIPTAILELDVHPGLATRLLARRVDQVWLAAPEAVSALPAAVAGRIRVIGAPIVPPDRSRRDAALRRFGLTPDQPVLVVTGGSQGSLAINRIVATWLGQGGGVGTQVIWATGRATCSEFAAWHDPPRVQVIPFIDPMADAWAVADLCIARSGMMTLAELCAWGIPSVLIPLPTAAADHQRHNADAMVSAGAAVAVPQDGLDAAQFAALLRGLLDDPARRAIMAERARQRARPDAAAEIAERVIALANVTASIDQRDGEGRHHGPP